MTDRQPHPALIHSESGTIRLSVAETARLFRSPAAMGWPESAVFRSPSMARWLRSEDCDDRGES